MKKTILWLMLFTVPIIAFSQQSTSRVLNTRDHYLTRSKNQKTAARILLGGGAASIATGVLVNFPARGGSFDDVLAKAAFVAIGTLSSIASIPVFIASGINKRRANRVTASVKIQQWPTLKMYNTSSIRYPEISVKVSL